MSKIPQELKYSKEHEWVVIDGDVATIGITDYAQSLLGDVVYLEIPEEGSELKKDDAFGVVESVKAVSDLFIPLSGTVIETNNELVDSPEKINTDCYSSWIIKVKVQNESELSELMDSTQYASFLETLEK